MPEPEPPLDVSPEHVVVARIPKGDDRQYIVVESDDEWIVWGLVDVSFS